jgi:hypothetical protein
VLALVQMKGWQQSFQPVMTSQFCLLSSELEGNGMICTGGVRLAHGVLGVVCPWTRRSDPFAPWSGQPWWCYRLLPLYRRVGSPAEEPYGAVAPWAAW